jgi:hypothetical protein
VACKKGETYLLYLHANGYKINRIWGCHLDSSGTGRDQILVLLKSVLRTRNFVEHLHDLNGNKFSVTHSCTLMKFLIVYFNIS